MTDYSFSSGFFYFQLSYFQLSHLRALLFRGRSGATTFCWWLAVAVG